MLSGAAHNLTRTMRFQVRIVESDLVDEPTKRVLRDSGFGTANGIRACNGKAVGMGTHRDWECEL
jgi:hypothetical protein